MTASHQPTSRVGMSSTAEMLLVLGVIIAAIAFLPVVAKFIGSQSQSVVSGQQSEIAADISDRISTITSQRSPHIAVTYHPPIQQYVLTVKEHNTISVKLPNTDSQEMRVESAYIENTQIEDADAICIKRSQDNITLTEGVCDHLDTVPPRG